MADTRRRIHHLKLRQLALLDALASTGTLRKAADRLHMNQPAATRLIAELEAELGARLFERSKQGMLATDSGQIMIRHARRVLTDLEHARSELDSWSAGERGHLNVGTFISAASVLLPRCVAEIKRRHPLLRIRIEQAAHEALIAALRNHELDLMIGRVLVQDDVDDLEYEVLGAEQFHVVCGRDNPLARKRRVGLAALVDEPWILPPGPGPLRTRLNAIFAAQAGRLPRNVVESLSLLANIPLINDAGFLAILPEQVARSYAGYRILSRLPVALGEILGPLALITRRGVPRSPAESEFRAIVREVAARNRA
jgi:DNA-binding transcriptional LysR family regulator